jgi:hypothetical protein
MGDGKISIGIGTLSVIDRQEKAITINTFSNKRVS